MKAKFFSEFFGTVFLVMIVLGSGIMGQRLFQNHTGLALLANSLSTGAGLFVLIQCLGPISGAHMNPVVSFVELLWGQLDKKTFTFYLMAQMLGAYLGVILVHSMFNLPIFEISNLDRSGSHLLISEIIATFGLICTIALTGRKHVEFAPMSVAAYIASAYWFTSSTSFANSAVTFARMFTNSFGGMAPSNFFPFIIAQFLGGVGSWLLIRSARLDSA